MADRYQARARAHRPRFPTATAHSDMSDLTQPWGTLISSRRRYAPREPFRSAEKFLRE
ncbi:hypothetical protein FRAHR75_10176 [Frankia sp. Hr75.2]|nr:hypothetical protein FRAHR75_10176 [Frankia sp. Hr75.2]